MNQRALYVAVGLFALIVIGMFIFAYLKRAELNTAPEPVPVETVDEEEPDTARRIDAKHFFTDGVHTLAGEIQMPTPCDLLTTSASVVDTDPERVVVDFDVINNSEDVCAQVITAQRFKVSFEASEDAVIEATYRGEPAILNLIEAGPDESPDDFELFIKG